MTQPDWEYERLDAAFHARFDRPAPAGLEKDVHARIAGTSPARLRASRIGRAWPLAAAVVVLLVAGTAMVSLGGLGRTSGSPMPSDAGADASSGPSPTPTEQALPGLVFDLPIMHLADAIAIRDGGIDDREIAVQGWFSDGGIPACPAPIPSLVNPLQVWCPDDFVWLMERPETLISHSGNGTTIASPSGPAVNPDLDGIDRSWEPPGNAVLDPNGLSLPIDVVLAGHFDDRRAALCPKAEVAACRDRFVVDSVARVHGIEPPLSVTGVAPGSTKSTVADIEAIVSNEAPQSPILSIVVVDPATDLSTIEPSLVHTEDGSLNHSTVWVVRVLETDRIATYIVRDGSDTIFEMNSDNHAIQVGGLPAGASVTPIASPVGGRTYALDCGQLGPDTCRINAADIVAASEASNPPRRVVSIRFLGDECGSYTVTFDDGTSAITIMDCFIPPS